MHILFLVYASSFVCSRLLKTLGRMGQVIKVHPNGDVRVLIDGKQYNFNGACCLPAPHGGLELNNTTATPTERDNDNNHRRSMLLSCIVRIGYMLPSINY